MAKHITIPSCMAFHGVSGLRQKYIDAVNIAYTNGTLETLGGDLFAASDECDSHVDYEITAEEQFGFPVQVLCCVDVLCMNLEIHDKQVFLIRFLNAVPIGADLNLVWPQLALWMLQNKLYGLIHKKGLDVDQYTLEKLYSMYHDWVSHGYIAPKSEWQELSDQLTAQSPSQANELLEGLIKATGWVDPDDSETHLLLPNWGIYTAFSAAADIHEETIAQQVDSGDVVSIGNDTAQTLSHVQRYQLLDLIKAAPVCSAEQIIAYQQHRKVDIRRAVNAA